MAETINAVMQRFNGTDNDTLLMKPSAHANTHGSDGTDPITPASIGAASTSHASTHATGGSDAITPTSIGAASLSNGKVVPTQLATAYTNITDDTYSLSSSDNGKLLVCNNTSGVTITVPSVGDGGFNSATEIELVQWNTGGITIAPASGVTVNSVDGSLTTSQRFACIALKLIYASTNTWLLAGALD